MERRRIYEPPVVMQGYLTRLVPMAVLIVDIEPRGI